MYDLISDIEVQGNLLIVKLFSLNFVFLSKSFFLQKVSLVFSLLNSKVTKRKTAWILQTFPLKMFSAFSWKTLARDFRADPGSIRIQLSGAFSGRVGSGFSLNPQTRITFVLTEKKNMAEILSGRNFFSNLVFLDGLGVYIMQNSKYYCEGGWLSFLGKKNIVQGKN